MTFRNILFLFLFIVCRNCSAQVSEEIKISTKHPADTTYLGFDSTFLNGLGKSALELFVDNLADSINNLRKSGVLPFFLEDPQFDYNNSGWSPSHHPYPLRKMIIAKVKDCQSLRILIAEKNKKYKLLPHKEHDIDLEYSNLSFHDLAVMRYQELNCSVMY
jgi:hypothetical protein